MQRITLRLENDVADWVRAEAIRLHTDESAVIRAAIHEERDRLRRLRRLAAEGARLTAKVRKKRSR